MTSIRRAAARNATLFAIALLAVVAGCDRDPAAPTGALALVSCPAGVHPVNDPIVLAFTEPVLPAAVSAANIVVTDARTGFEIPGAVRLSATDPTQVIFTPSAPFPFDTAVRVRVQNLLPTNGGAALGVTVCNLRTELPPIRELYWRELPSAGGDNLLGVSLVDPTYGYVAASSNTLFRYPDTGSVASIPLPPYYSSAYDVAFVSRTRGFAIANRFRTNQSFLLSTNDGGITFDTVGSISNSGFSRSYFRPIPSADKPFGVVGGGRTFSPAVFAKYLPESGVLAAPQSFSSAGLVSDIAFSHDTLTGAASTLGAAFGTSVILGAVFHSTDGGSNWSEIANARAPDSVLTYIGVGVQPSGNIWVVGANGYVAKLTPSGGAYSVSQVILPIANPDPGNRLALQFTDIEFSPTDNQIGWIVGQYQSGVVNGVPRYAGIIFMTRDGGATWTRQGVLGATNYGAAFPALTRLDVLSSTSVWAVGNGGVVIRFAGAGAS